MSDAFRPRNPTGTALRALAEVVGATTPTAVPDDLRVTGVAVEDGEVRPGDLFVAMPGAHTHGVRFVPAALSAGAVAVLTDAAGAEALAASTVPVLVVPSPRAVLGRTAAVVFGTSAPSATLFGVTGTNGKTSSVYLLDAVMRRLGWRTALTSTAERHVGDRVIASRLTTPEASELHGFLAAALEHGADGVALEISAQALSRHRVDGVVVDVAGFTNLSHDHLDEYADLDAYLAAKALLFRPDRSRRAVVSLDSAAGVRIAASAEVPLTTITSRPDTAADWHVTVLEQRPDATRFRLDGPGGATVTTEVPLLGVHMAANTGLAIVMLAASGVPFPDLVRAVGARLDVDVPGRMADASAATGPRVFVDFAHTPDAFEKSLIAMRAFTVGPLVMVVGADGDKDPTKRAGMGEVGARHADVVIVADHHPRHEDPDAIRAAILAGARGAGTDTTILEIADPPTAIRAALRHAGADGAVYWAGPGLTDYRIIGDAHVPYSSYEDAGVALAEAGWGVGVEA
ncbi:UDP-N-acetylmuramoyl-L-alanyl-D-glutamate--2,6-diaminopimelate ligase [Curtobacterium sp. MCBD17_035]|uniref:Mur ligase family protein n=1 Tax=Curtobacterium sp. MCBD17_035 TaxID=2175673 RepID=UPI000DA9AC61|nr:UDP-N-acetylmuramoyl-L-alanyl-D-glutamate--2,6-diaminopimelate ligase [Curtobacterium sp. MCBD17_035]WIB66812.1 UDP-N-acetylmuramoyl-L-alanyl-D-glutamate--2,6-diaminopimelate ligase [Curtobacterium sp. MCBD17_035]